MRLLTAAFLLLLGSDANGRAHVPAHEQHRSHPVVVTADDRALLGTTTAQDDVAGAWKDVNTARKDVDRTPPLLLASAASVHDDRILLAPRPTRTSSSRSHERTTAQAARPPPFQA